MEGNDNNGGAVSRAELGRRSFLLSLGAFALTGCGAGAGGTSAPRCSRAP